MIAPASVKLEHVDGAKRISAVARPAFPLAQLAPHAAFNRLTKPVRDGFVSLDQRTGLDESPKLSHNSHQGPYPPNREEDQSKGHTSLDFTGNNKKSYHPLNSPDAHWDDVHANMRPTVSAQDFLAPRNYVISQCLSPHDSLSGDHDFARQHAKIDHSEFEVAYREFVNSADVNPSKAFSSANTNPRSMATHPSKLGVLNSSTVKHLPSVSFEASREILSKSNQFEKHIKPQPSVDGKLESTSHTIGAGESVKSNIRFLRKFQDSQDPTVFPDGNSNLRLIRSNNRISEEVVPSLQSQLVITEAKETDIRDSKPSNNEQGKEVENELDESVTKTANPSSSDINQKEGKLQKKLRNKKDEKLFKKLLRKEKVEQKRTENKTSGSERRVRVEKESFGARKPLLTGESVSDNKRKVQSPIVSIESTKVDCSLPMKGRTEEEIFKPSLCTMIRL